LEGPASHRWVGVLRLRQLHQRGHQIVRVHPRVHPRELAEAAKQESRPAAPAGAPTSFFGPPPGSPRVSWPKLRSRSPAPTSSTRASATSATVSAALVRMRARPVPADPPPPFFRA